jgi:predicted patatin/cPLA2 family phospholipase
MYDTIVLSGNNTNAVVILGALQFLKDNKILKRVDNYVATSSGSIISLLLILNYTPLDILTLICSNHLFKKININFFNFLHNKSIIDFDIIRNEIESFVLNKLHFIPTLGYLKTKLNKTLVVTTYNVTKNQLEYITPDTHSDISVLDAIQMSCSFPFVFELFSYKNNYYIDGGILDNFPIEIGEKISKNCLGLVLKNPLISLGPNYSAFSLFLKIIQIVIISTLTNKIKKTTCDVIQIEHKIGFFNFSHDNKEIILMFDAGYARCKEFILNL